MDMNIFKKMFRRKNSSEQPSNRDVVSFLFLKRMFITTHDAMIMQYHGPLNYVMHKFNITTKPRIASFVAQIGHESGYLTTREENLNYSATGLRKTFGKYFPNDQIAEQYARNPEKIASRVYANRIGNGPEHTGDGWTFRGRGLIQLTGKYNYIKFAESFNMSINDTIEYLSTPKGAAMSAGWFWDTRSLNNFADRGDFIGMTRVINGGTNGLEDRQKLYENALSYL